MFETPEGEGTWGLSNRDVSNTGKLGTLAKLISALKTPERSVFGQMWFAVSEVLKTVHRAKSISGVQTSEREVTEADVDLRCSIN